MTLRIVPEMCQNKKKEEKRGDKDKMVYPEAPAQAKRTSYAVSRRSSSVIPITNKEKSLKHTLQCYILN